jgi:hypothetical protein
MAGEDVKTKFSLPPKILKVLIRINLEYSRIISGTS